MRNLDPPRDPLKVWTHYVEGQIRIGDNAIDPHYVLATLREDQARDLLHELARVLGATIFRDRAVFGVAWYWGDSGTCRACGARNANAGQLPNCPTCGFEGDDD